MKRRSLIAALVAVPAGILALRLPAATRSNADIEQMQASWARLLPEDFKLPDTGHRLERSEQEWRQQLSPAQYEVLREEGTERPFSSALNDEKGAGIFVCSGFLGPWPFMWPMAWGIHIVFISVGPVRTTVSSSIRCEIQPIYLVRANGDGPPTWWRIKKGCISCCAE